MRRMKHIILLISIVTAFVLGLSGCSMSGSTAQATKGAAVDNKARTQTYNGLVANQPAHTGTYSPTRATKNFWIDTWMKNPNKLAYIYMQNASGQVYGYYITVGLPVSYCTSLVPPTQIKIYDGGADGAQVPVQMPAPSVDGTYSSSSNCNAFYGKDAVDGSYIEYFAGMGNNPMIFDQPKPQYGDAMPLAKASITGVKGK